MLYSTNEPEIIKTLDGYSLIMPPALVIEETNNINKEDKNMANRNTTTKTPVFLYNYEDSPEDVEFEKKRKELMDEIDSQLYADNGDGSYSGVKWCDMISATIECKCNEKPKIDIPSKEFISDHIYTLLAFHGQDLSEFEVSVMHHRDPTCTYLELSVFLDNYAYQTRHHISMLIFDNSTPRKVEAIVEENLNALVMTCLAEIKTKTKINNKKENDIMAQYTYEKFEVIKSQEEIELEEKIAKLRAEYDKKVAKLREEFKTAQEKKARDAKAKELHDKYQSLIDAGFSTEQAYDILQTKIKLDEF